MSVGKTVRSNYIYLNSETHSDGLGRVRVSLPSEQFRINPGEMQRLTIQSFEMPLYFHTINKTNKWFFWFSPLGNFYSSIEIPEGTYDSFESLSGAIAAALGEVFDVPDCSYDAVKRMFEIEPGDSMSDGITAVDPDGYFVSFYASAFAPPAGISAEQFHQNTRRGSPTMTASPPSRSVCMLKDNHAVRSSPALASFCTLTRIRNAARRGAGYDAKQ